MEKLPGARTSDIVVQNLDGEVLIYDLTNHKAYTLNKMSAAVWNLCDGTRQVSEIAKALSDHLKQPVTAELVYIALDQFKEDNLLAANETVEIKFGGLSRRQMIRKVGLASMVALPLVVGLVAPSAAQAASGATCSPHACTTNANCPSPCTSCTGTTLFCYLDYNDAGACSTLGSPCGGQATCVYYAPGNGICNNAINDLISCTSNAECLNNGTCTTRPNSGTCG